MENLIDFSDPILRLYDYLFKKKGAKDEIPH